MIFFLIGAFDSLLPVNQETCDKGFVQVKTLKRGKRTQYFDIERLLIETLQRSHKSQK